MCLLVKENDKVLIAKRDLTCYKVLFSEIFCDVEIYETYYQDEPVKIGETYTSILNKRGDLVYQGLHSFKYLRQINKFYESQGCCGGNFVIVKCLIPKGTEYYNGLFDGYASIASTQLTYIEVIKKR